MTFKELLGGIASALPIAFAAIAGFYAWAWWVCVVIDR